MVHPKQNSFKPSDNGQKVFEFYGLSSSNKAQINPFRQERTNSFYVKQGKDGLYFKDFGDDDIKGNWYKLISLFEQTTEPREIIRIAKSIYTGQAIAPTHHAPKQPSPQYGKEPNKPSKLGSIQFKEFTESELNYWYGKGQISQATLLKLGVKSVFSFEIEHANKAPYKAINQNFVFAYPTISQEAYKLYLPNQATRPNYYKSKTAYLPNLQACKAIEQGYEYFFGIDNLQAGTAIICEGEADCLALIEQGYNAFTLGSVKIELKEPILAKLKAKSISHILILFDTDFAGISHAQKLKESLSQHFSCSIIDLPKLPRQEQENQAKPAKNDVCDYIGLYGFDSDLRQVIEASLPFTVQKYLSEISPRLKALINQHKGQILSIKAPTGVGKTHTLIKDILPSLFGSSVFCVPTKIQAGQFAQKNYNLVAMHGSKQISQEYLSQSVKPCTYDRAMSVCKAGSFEALVIDESHQLSQDFGYRSKAMQELTKLIIEAKQAGKTVIFLSATPCNLIEESFEAKRISIERTINPRVQIKRLGYENFASDVLSYLSEFDYSDKAVLCKIGSIKKAKSLANTLIQKGILSQNEIDFVISTKREQDKTETQNSIEKTSLIPLTKKLVFGTKILDIGTNIENTNLHLVYATTQKELPSDLIQFCARVRNMQNVSLTLFERFEQSQAKPKSKPRHSLNQLKELASLQSKSLNLQDIETPKSQVLRANHKLHLDLNQLTIKTSNGYQVNNTYISHYLNERLLQAQTRAQYIEVLTKQGFEISSLTLYQPHNFLENLSNPYLLKEAGKKIKRDLQEFENVLCDTWQASEKGRQELKQDLANNYESKELSKALKIPRTKEPATSTAKGFLQANLFVKFFEFIVLMIRYHITDYALQSKLARLHLGNASKLIDTLKNYNLLAYPKEALSHYYNKPYAKQRDILERIIEAVQEISTSQANEYKTAISQAKRAKTLFENRVNATIAQSSKKTSLNAIEQKQLTALTNKIKKLESYSMSIELSEFLNLVRIKAKLTDISNKNLIDTIATLFEVSKKREIRQAGETIERKTYLYVGKKKSYQEALIELGFDAIEARNFEIKSRELMSQEIQALIFLESTQKQPLKHKESRFLASLNITKMPRNTYINKKNVIDGNLVTQNYSQVLSTCPF